MSITPKVSVLIISPFAFEPMDAGHRRRVAQSLNFFSDFEITFILYAFEGAWLYTYQKGIVSAMRRIVADVAIYKALSYIGSSPRSGDLHQLDEWYDQGFESYLQNIIGLRTFDAVVVHNVWMSKYLDLFPRCTVKIIESHDIFSDRPKAFAAAGVAPEFFVTSEKDEVFGYNRADIVITIQDNDKKWISDRCKCVSTTVPYVPPGITKGNSSKISGYQHSDRVTFGFIGLSHAFNIAGIRELLIRLKTIIGETLSPVHLLIGGTVCEKLDDLKSGFWTSLGWIPDETSILKLCDIMIAPVANGTGFKIKVADNLWSSKPMLATEHAAIGIPALDESWVVHNVEALANRMACISLVRPSMNNAYHFLGLSSHELVRRYQDGKRRLMYLINLKIPIVVFDLLNLPENLACAYLAAISGALRISATYSKVFIVSKSPRIRTLAVKYLSHVSVEEVLLESYAQGKRSVYVGDDKLGPKSKFDIHIQMSPWNRVASGVEHHPVFGSNSSWDPLFREALFYAVKQNKRGVKSNKVALLGTIEQVNSLFLVNTSSGFQFYYLDDVQSLESLVSELVCGEIDRLILMEDTGNSARYFVWRLAEIKSVETLDLGVNRSEKAYKGVADYDTFWRELLHSLTVRNAAVEGAFSNIYGSIVLKPSQLAKDQTALHQLETDHNGREMIWASGEAPLHFRLHDMGESITVKIAGLSCISQQKVVCTIGDREIVVPFPHGTMQEIDFEFEITELLGGQEDLSLEFSKGIRPCDDDLSNRDERRLSFLIYEIEISSTEDHLISHKLDRDS